MKRIISLLLVFSMITIMSVNVVAGNISLEERIAIRDSAYTRSVNGDVVNVTVTDGNIVVTLMYNEITKNYELVVLEDGKVGVHRVGYAITDEYQTLASNTITTEEDELFGYSYYYNTQAAYGDLYWRLVDPHKDEPQKNFFTEEGSSNETYAERFVEEVDGIISATREANLIVVWEVLLQIVGIVGDGLSYSGNGLGLAIKAAAVALGATTDVVEPLSDAYACAFDADMWFDFIDETIRPE